MTHEFTGNENHSAICCPPVRIPKKMEDCFSVIILIFSPIPALVYFNKSANIYSVFAMSLVTVLSSAAMLMDQENGFIVSRSLYLVEKLFQGLVSIMINV